MNAQTTGSKLFGLFIVVVATTLVVGWVLLATARGGAATGDVQPPWAADPERSVAGDVQITLTPRGISAGVFRVDVRVNTHSGDLGHLDLRTATELRVGDRTYRPSTATALGGHHAGGRLEFALDRVPEAFEIVIRGVRTMGDLTFRWP